MTVENPQSQIVWTAGTCMASPPHRMKHAVRDDRTAEGHVDSPLFPTHTQATSVLPDIGQAGREIL